MKTVEQKREYIAAEYERIQNDLEMLIDTFEISDLKLNHAATVYSVNKLITIQNMFNCLKNALNDTN